MSKKRFPNIVSKTADQIRRAAEAGESKIGENKASENKAGAKKRVDTRGMTASAPTPSAPPNIATPDIPTPDADHFTAGTTGKPGLAQTAAQIAADEAAFKQIPDNVTTPSRNLPPAGDEDRNAARTASAETKETSGWQSVESELKLDPVLRREYARLLIDRHVTYSALGGLIPLPILPFATVAAVTIRMVQALCTNYDVPFERTRAKAIVTGLMAGAAGPGVSIMTRMTILHYMPGANLVGLGLSSVTAAVSTRSIGEIFFRHFEAGAKTLEPSAPANG